MVFVYYGQDPEMINRVKAVKDRLNERYYEILGDNNYEKLQGVVDRTLVPGSFIESVKDIKEVLDQELPENTSNKFFVGCSDDKLETDKEWRVKKGKIRTCPGFYISREGFTNSSYSQISDDPVTSYIHEFDHFIWYALQDVPLYLANLVIQSKLDFNSNGESFKALEKIMGSNDPNPKKIEDLMTLTSYRLINDIYEGSNRILDKMVMSSIGINVPLEWRHQPKRYVLIPTNLGAAITFPAFGDNFAGLSDDEVVRKVLKWEEHFSLMSSFPNVKNLIESLKGVRVSRVPITDILSELKS